MACLQDGVCDEAYVVCLRRGWGRDANYCLADASVCDVPCTQVMKVETEHLEDWIESTPDKPVLADSPR